MRRLSILLAAVVALLVPVAVARADTVALPNSMAAAGDSITRGFDATLFGCLLSDCPNYSWSTGASSSVTSQYRRGVAAHPPPAGGALYDAHTRAEKGAPPPPPPGPGRPGGG